MLTQYQYLTSQAGCKLSRNEFDEQRFLETYFDTVTTKWVYINFPRLAFSRAARRLPRAASAE